MNGAIRKLARNLTGSRDQRRPLPGTLSESGSDHSDLEDVSDKEGSESMKFEELAEHQRGLIEILKELHSTGIQQDLKILPQICVVGSQSAGKSSLIEAMSGITLPRSSGTCTRCPTECRLEHADTWSCEIKLHFEFGETDNRLEKSRIVSFGSVTDETKVEGMLRAAQQAILHPSMDHQHFLDCNVKTPESKALTFSRNYISIRIRGPDVPDLYFHDLPGIIENVDDEGNVEDIELVKELVKSYIARPHCIILLVISCDTDYHNQGAGRLVKDNGVQSRVLGVLTKVDRIEAGEGEATWLKHLHNEENKLAHGWYAVKLRGPNQLGISPKEAKALEKSFFETNSPWAQLGEDARQRLGSPALVKKLSRVLSDLVFQQLPAIRTEIAQQLYAVNTALLKMPTPSYTDSKKEVLRLFRVFQDRLRHNMEALPGPEGDDRSLPHLRYDIETVLDDFREYVRDTTPRFVPWDSSLSGKLAPSTLEAMNALIQDPDELSSVGKRTSDLPRVMDVATKCRTDELPGIYPFTAHQWLIREFTESWKSLAQTCFEGVEKVVTQHVTELIETCFKDQARSGLKDTVQQIVLDNLRERARSALEKIHSLDNNERNPLTMDDQTYTAWRTVLLGKYRAAYHRSTPHDTFLQAITSYVCPPSVPVPADALHALRPAGYRSTNEEIETILMALSRLKARGIVAADLSKLLPEDDATPALKIMACVKAYFKVASKRFVDNIRLQIDSAFVHKLDQDLGFALYSSDMTTEQCVKWLEEDPTISRKRNDLIAKKQRLESAREKLDAYARKTAARDST